MRNIFINKKKGSEVVESLIIIAIMGTLAITTLYSLNKTIINKSSTVDTSIISSQSLDVNSVMSQLKK